MATIEEIDLKDVDKGIRDGLDLRLHDPCRGALAMQPQQPDLARLHHLRQARKGCAIEG